MVTRIPTCLPCFLYRYWMLVKSGLVSFYVLALHAHELLHVSTVRLFVLGLGYSALYLVNRSL